ncbi:exodeoxyribonuclease V subunit alpha [Sulfuricystis thermophila]|uniref:exodeoxyribonuclease V subunit alpha n=1 Tax=Sulfuricystis thermophila TaxID=2496847 RepID=UPI001035CC28|nr:exodeoxyribonuclease V subunit alpha [Sulfuricystis thermophila]
MTPMALPAIVRHFARFLGAGDADAERAAALACLATLEGHVCADLDCDTGWGPWAASLDEAGRAAFRARLSQLAIVGAEQDLTPLVWDGRRLYLRRYWDYEARVAADLLARSSSAATEAEPDELLAAHFPDAGQRHAGQIALSRRLALISGGPGTGKTHTLARIIGRLQSQQPDLRIALAAPTGKAAARMGEALLAAGVTVAEEARTIHRLLGVRAEGGFRHDREHPLAVDVLVVDEASMIDLSLMAHLLFALPQQARLILLGDRDQLAAVEAGAVFADLCESPRLAGCVAMLKTNFRFGAESGIGRLAECLRLGDADGALALLTTAGEDLVWTMRSDSHALIRAAREGYQDYLAGVAEGRAPEELFARFDGFRVLCAHREEAETLNHALTGDPLRPPLGTPIMVLRNDPLLRVFNGDIGLLLNDPADGRQKVFFPGETPRWIALNRLPEWSPAWAMTVHKAQGSEFAEVLLALPATVSPVVTRELVYTGVTRAKRRVLLWSSEAVLRAATGRRSLRMSGLRERLA